MLVADIRQWRWLSGGIVASPPKQEFRRHSASRAHYPQRRSNSRFENRKDIPRHSNSKSEKDRKESIWEWAMEDEIPDTSNTSQNSNLLDFFATCAPGVEFVVAAELSSASIGALNIRPGSAGVAFQGYSMEVAFRANLWLRCAVRVLHQIAAGQLESSSRDPVYEFVQSAVVWSDYLGSSARHLRTFSVQSRVWDCPDMVTSAKTASIRAKDAICDSLRRSCNGVRPEPPDIPCTADVPLFLSLYRGRAVLYRDLSGVSLHMRGYRDAMHKASLNEGIAAAMLTISGWNPWVTSAIQTCASTDGDYLKFGSRNKGPRQDGGVLLDPMCGSGTILIEAALMALNRAPGLFRKTWPFQNWHDFEKTAWDRCLSKAASEEVAAPKDMLLLANDFHKGAIALCLRDSEKAGVRQHMKISCKDCLDYVPPIIPSMVMVNPPWGSRLEQHQDSRLISAYSSLGKLLKCHCPDTDVYLLSGNSTLTREMQMKADRKWPVTVGGLDCRLLHYHVLGPKAP